MRYLLKFKKEDYSVYISHLDIMRFFKRTFKRSGIFLQYSQGFNPHPKMSFAQPLSLGYIGLAEYLEFETKEDFEPSDIKEKLQSLMPSGLEVIECKTLKSEGKTMAALVEKAEYSIFIPNINNWSENQTSELLKSFMEQKEILVKKIQKKTGKETSVDIKSMIFNIEITVDNNITLKTLLAAGSNLNLSPELLVTSFCEFTKLNIQRFEIKIARNEIYFSR